MKMKQPHIGLHADRLKPERDNPREVAFANRWAYEQENHLLEKLLDGTCSDGNAVVAATVIQWLGSNVGMSFLEEVILSSPEIQQYLKQRAFNKTT